MNKAQRLPLIAFLAFVVPSLILPFAQAEQLRCESLFDNSWNLSVETESSAQVLFASMPTRSHADGVSPLLDDIAFTPFTSRDWQNWLLRPRSAPVLDYLAKLSSSANLKEQLHNLKLSDIIAKPGHMIVRSPQQIAWFANEAPKLSAAFEKRGKPDPAVLNVVTDYSGKVIFVDSWDGHHRLLGALQAGTRTLGELPSDAVVVLRNGREASGDLQKTTPPAAGVDFRNLHSWRQINSMPYLNPNRSQSRYADVWLNGSVSNWVQGSVFTLSDILQSNTTAPRHKIAVVDLSLTGDISLESLTKLESLGYSEVLFISSTKSLSKSEIIAARRQNIELARRGRNLRVNVYLADAKVFMSSFGRDAFLRRVQQTYITLAPPQFFDIALGEADPTMPLGFDIKPSQ